MTRNTTEQALDRLARGESIGEAAFLALLADPAARQDLRQLAQVRAVLASTGGEPAAPQGMATDVSWEELARHAEGTLTDENRRLAAERFLNQHFPEALQAPAGKGDTAIVSIPGTADTVVEPP